MTLTVWLANWQLEEDHWHVSVGDELAGWLRFEEAERPGLPAERIQVVHGLARPLPAWPGSELGRHPVQIDLDRGALYWEAPAPTAGLVDVAGAVSLDTTDAPDGFPETHGVVRRVRMERRDLAPHPSHPFTDRRARYEDVPVSYLPSITHGRRTFWDFVARRGAALSHVSSDWTGVLIDLEI